MRILTLQGSPRLRGNTATVLLGFEKQASAAGHAVEHVDVARLNVGGCRGCGACQDVFDTPACRQDDDALPLFERLRAADLVVFATPLYAWSFTAQFKPLLDRMYCLTKWRAPGGRRSLTAGVRAALLVTCGDEVEGNADVIQTIFARMTSVAEMPVAGIYVVPECSSRGGLGPEAPAVQARMAVELL